MSGGTFERSFGTLAAAFLGSAVACLTWLAAAERIEGRRGERVRQVDSPNTVNVLGHNQLLRAENFRLEGRVLDYDERLARAEAELAALRDALRRSGGRGGTGGAGNAGGPDVRPEDRIPPPGVPER